LEHFGARTNHGQTRTHKTHHGPDLGEATTFPLIVYSVLATRPTFKCHFVSGLPSGSPEIPTTGTPTTLGPITLCANLRLRWALKQSCTSCRELSNDLSHATFTHGNWGDSWLLVVESQIVNLILDFSFCHNLCFKYPNGSCEPILDMYVPRDFQWYKELLNPMGFVPCNYSLRIWEFTWTPTPKVRAHLGMWGFIPSHSLALLGTWNVTFGLHIWPAPSQALALVVSLRLRLWQHMLFTL